ETEFLVVIRADPFGGIDCALLERRVDVPCRHLLRHAADLRNDGPGETPNAEFKAFEILGRLDFLAEPAAHLRTRAASRNTVAVVLSQQIVEQVHTAAEQ